MATDITVTTLIRKNRQTVYQALRDIERFPSFLKDVKQIVLRSSNGNKIVTDWKVDIDGTPIQWSQETLLDDRNQRVIHFKMLEGDYDQYEGTWLLEEIDKNATRVKVCVHFNWGVPGLERFIGKTFEEKARATLKGMLFALRKELERKT